MEKKSTFDYDNKTDFTQIKTYQWDSSTSAEFAKTNPLIDKRIVSAIEKELNSKGLIREESADILISYNVSFEKKLSNSAISAGVGMSVGSSNRGHISLSSGNKLRQTIEGALLIDMISTKTSTLIWRGSSVQSVKSTSPSPQDSDKKINSLIKEMLDNYPPGTQS